MSKNTKRPAAPWWQGAFLYQIYPRSFLDTNGDGVGDLNGITRKLEYIASLGVDGIWISPFFKSPMKDFGYDVSDYRDIDPLFGTMDDFDALLKQAHILGLKVIIDLVLSHTSDQHPWFTDPAKKDWYVWADPKPDMFGEVTPPNNWVSVFGGSAWEYNAAHEEFYLHNFLKEQPDLNFHNQDVQDEALDICRFWLDKGVDGFRLDVVNFYFHDQELRDNPPRAAELGAATQFEGGDLYSTQTHIYDKSRPEMHPFLRRLRALMDDYNAFTVGEIGDDHPLKMAAAYTDGDDLLHTTYNTQMMSGMHKALTPALIRTPIEAFLDHPGTGWPSWSFSNHDVVRVASRWLADCGGFGHDEQLSKMLIALLGCLYGTIFLYQGEELGLPESKLEFEQLQDPWGISLWPQWQGRDGCRTPMPWRANIPKTQWLPVPDQHLDLNVQSQEQAPASTLSFTRAFIKWRKTQPALLSGSISFHDDGENILSFTRKINGIAISCRFDLENYEFFVEGFSPPSPTIASDES